MPLFWFHESQGPPLVIWSGARAGMGQMENAPMIL